MSGKEPSDDHTEIVRHVKVDEADRIAADTDDLPTYFITAKSQEPVAKLVVVGGPGAGNARPVFAGTNSIGREASNRIPLDFGDDTISRKQHAVIVVDPATGDMDIRDGGKVNPIIVNGTVVTAKAELKIGDTVELGTTTLLVQKA
jgi:pSer/pThr/pTyr-binding forkhead associated (FHA) protein